MMNGDYGESGSNEAEIVSGRSFVAKNQMNIVISSEAMDLEGLANSSVEKIGEQISFEVDYRNIGDRVTRINLVLHPNDVGRGIYGTLMKVAEEIVECKEYKRILKEIDVNGRYLGELGIGVDVSREVGDYLERAYRHSEDVWGVTQKDICSVKKNRDVAKIRHAIFYLLRKKFANGFDIRNSGGRISTSCIGKIMGGKNHATVIQGCNRVEGVLKKKKKRVKDFDSVESALDNVVNVLGGIEVNHNNA